jgi:hypothetical protein
MTQSERLNSKISRRVQNSGMLSDDGVAPRVMLVATLPWIFPVRFAIVLRDIGFEVEIACPAGHIVQTLIQRPKMHRLRMFSESSDLSKAMKTADPDLVIPCDDRAVSILHKLHRDSHDEALKARIEFSLGRPDSYAPIASKSQLLALARRLGLMTPDSKPMGDTTELATMLAQSSYPQVLKRDGTWSGKGVRIVHSHVEALRAWRQLTRRPDLFTAARLAFFDGARVFLDRMANAPTAIDCQQFVTGRPANRASLFIDGEEIAGINVLACETAFGVTGPSSVVQLIEHQDMVQTAKCLGRHLGLSGLCGFDFIISNSDDRAYLLEANPRLTPSAGLAFLDMPFLPQELFKHLASREGRTPQTIINGKTVAFFPDEWGRDPNSPHLDQAHHDVPWEEPGLVKIGFKHIAHRRAALRLRGIIAYLKTILMSRTQVWLNNLRPALVPLPLTIQWSTNQDPSTEALHQNDQYAIGHQCINPLIAND